MVCHNDIYGDGGMVANEQGLRHVCEAKMQMVDVICNSTDAQRKIKNELLNLRKIYTLNSTGKYIQLGEMLYLQFISKMF